MTVNPNKKLSRSHVITIRITVNRPISKRQAQYAAWNALHGYDLYGNGKGDSAEPFDTGKIRVRKP